VLEGRAKIRPIADQLERAIPPGEALYAVNPDYQPFLFYLQRTIFYVSEVADLPQAARYILVQPTDLKKVEESTRWSPQRAEPILPPIKDYRGRRVILLRVRGNSAHPD